MTKASAAELCRIVKEHLERYPLETKLPGLFRVYSHEDFTKWDRAASVETIKDGDLTKETHAPDLSHGLDDLKIQTRKAYFNRTNIIDVLRELQKEFKGTLEIPAPGSFKTTLDEYRERHAKLPERTLWLVNDSELVPGSVHPGPKRYYVCYDQLWFNNDPFTAFDEDKPAWFSHTTIPHSLAAAMINITRPWRQDEVLLIDPFGGSGTMLLEALKRPEVRPLTGDLERLANQVAKDNLEFFTLPARRVTELRDILKAYFDQGTLTEALDPKSDAHPDFVKAKAELDAAIEEMKTESNPWLKRADAVSQLTLVQRMLFYVFLRTRLRHVAELSEGRTRWPTAFRQELLNVVLRLNSHLNFLELNEKKQVSAGLCFAIGDYSKVCWLSLDPKKGASEYIRNQDATKLEENAYDLIITDPPYGFNTREEDIQLIKLYREFIWGAVGALRDGGQLIICCPHYSYSGRHVPVFIQPEFVTQQVLLAARDRDKVTRSEQYSLPAELRGLKPPYYWEALTALQRSILHFRFQSEQRRRQ